MPPRIDTLLGTVRRTAASLAVVAVLLLGCGSDAPPNVVLITLDALRQDHLSLFGYERPTSPNIDWLAGRGRIFRDVVPTSCSTKASLTSLLTSLDYSSHGIIHHAAMVGDGHEMLAETFRRNGYATAGVVATPHLSASLGYGQGYDQYTDHADLEVDYITADLVMAGAQRFLDSPRPSKQPFFLYLHLEEPHPPWNHPSPWVENGTSTTRFFDEGCGHIPTREELDTLDADERFDLIAKYDGALRFADEQIGRLIQQLRSRGDLDNTIIAVSTDHGLELLDRYSASHGFNPFDEVLRGFLVLFDGRSTDHSVQLEEGQGRIFDIGPTLLGLAGLPAPEGLDGVDLIRERDRLPRFAYSTCYGFEAVRSLDHKLIFFDLTLARRRYKSTNRPTNMREGIQLFDLRADPGERTDLSEELPRVRQQMWRQLRLYRKKLRERTSDAPTVADEERSDQELDRLRALGYVD